MYYLGKLLTYGHQICIVGALGMCAPNDRFIFGLICFQGHRGQSLKIELCVNRGVTNRNRCTQRLVILHAQTY